MTTVCATCHQPILDGEMSFDRSVYRHHTRASDCVAATARRFEAIVQAVKEGAAIVGGPDGAGAYRACAVILDAVRKEFNLEPK